MASGFSAASHGFLYPPSAARSVILPHPPLLSDARSHQVHQLFSERNTAPLIMSLLSLPRPHVPIITSTIPPSLAVEIGLFFSLSCFLLPSGSSHTSIHDLFFVAVVDRYPSHYSGILDRRHLPNNCILYLYTDTHESQFF